jgi:alkanesulfonate monooxygenase SsuD/methylene tetrahydromethanopterin reductase-like flavin-dependent oxidoreductase (luciferase family)
MAFLGVRLGNEAQLNPSDIQELAVAAESLGYQEIWMTEGSGRDSLTQLASIATSTNKIVAGTGILPIYSRSPLMTAMSAAGLASVSGGRFILGLGVGNRPATQMGHGVRFAKPLDRLRETIYIVRRLLQGDEVTFQGKALRISEASLGDAAPQERVPIYIAALGPRMLRLAGEMADGVLLSWAASSYLKEAIRQVREGAISAGRDPDEVEISGYVRVAVTDDEEAGWLALKSQVARYAGSTHYRNYFRFTGFIYEMDEVERSGPRSAAEAIGFEMQRELGLVGTAQECRAGLEELRALGLTKPVVAPLPVGDLKKAYEATIEGLAPGA